MSILDAKILVFDGAVGTELYDRGFYINRPFEELNLSAPADVRAVHSAYIRAGAQVITTNTFCISKPQLKKFDIENKQEDLLRAALKIASDAVGEAMASEPSTASSPTLIGLSLGPTGELVEPLGPTSLAEVKEEFSNLARLALGAGHPFDLYILETFTNLSELENAVEGLRNFDSRHPILASVSVKAGELSFLKDFAARFASHKDVWALGLNCSEGPSQMLSALNVLAPLCQKPIVVQPNAGIPQQINGRYFYMTSPDYMAKFAKRFVEAGATGVGGCCGTGPAHVQAVAGALKMVSAKVSAGRELKPEANSKSSIENVSALAAARRSWAERNTSAVGQCLAAGKKVVSIELTPPAGPSLEDFNKKLGLIEKAGVRFVNVPDGPRASVRVSSLHLASAIKNRTQSKITILPHFTTRDRNLLALQADLLGAFVNGVSDVLLVTGDPPKLGNNKEATGVYNIDSIGLTRVVDCLNRGVNPLGESIGQPTNFGIGVASNPTALNLELEAERWRYKCEMGADFAVTQPIFDAEFYTRWLDRIGSVMRPHIVGIWPLISLRNAEFMANEVPGVHVPKWALEEMAKANDKSEAIKRGIEISVRVIRSLEKLCSGFCISAPLGKVEVALEVAAEVIRVGEKNSA